MLLFPLPWFLRIHILNLIPGFKIEKSARIGYSLILAEILFMENESQISDFIFINNIDKVHLKPFSKVGKLNWLTGTNKYSNFFRDSNRKCELILGTHARITGQHHLDCTGGIYIGDFTTIAGTRSQILTHSIDLKLSKQVANPVHIGKYCFVGTATIILKGTQLPDYSILGAGAVLTKNFEDPYHLYAGNPARQVKKLEKDAYKYFKRDHGHVV